MSTKVIFGSDHAGKRLKSKLVTRALHLGLIDDMDDVGCHNEDSCDYPDFAHAACNKWRPGIFVVLVCGTGQGMCMTANRHQDIRAGVAWNADIARAMREHNDANVLCLPARHLSVDEAYATLEAFLTTSASTEPRHARRVEKIARDQSFERNSTCT